MLLPILLAIILVFVGGAASLATWGTPGWGSGRPLLSSAPGSQIVDAVAMSPSGSGFAAWTQRVGDGYRVYAAQFLPDSGWTLGVPVDGSASSGAKVAKLAVADTGQAIVAWTEGWGPSSMDANRFVPGRGWESPTTLGRDDWGDIEGFALATDALGNGIVVWSQFEPDPATGRDVGQMRSVRLNGSTGWGPSESIGEGWVSAAVLLADGTAVASWAVTGGVNATVSMQPSGGSWSTPVVLNGDTGSETGDVLLCSAGSSNLVAVWTQYQNASLSLWSSTYASGTLWSSLQALPGLSGNAVVGDLACGPNGQALAVWVDANFQARNLGAAWWDARTGWSNPFLLGVPSAAGVQWPHAALDGQGNAMIVWWEQGSETHSFLGAFKRGDTQVSSMQLDSADGAVAPVIAMDAQGDALVVWERDSGTDSSAWTNRYLVPGPLRIAVGWVAGFLAAAAAMTAFTAWWWRRELRNPARPPAPTQPPRRETS